MLQNFKWPIPKDESDKRIIANVQHAGCQVMAIGADRRVGTPDYIYTIGFHVSYEQPEILVLGVNGETGGRIVDALNKRFRAGLPLETDMLIPALDNSRDFKFREVPRERYVDYVGYTVWFYGRTLEFRLLQALWPDQSGLFPGKAGCDKRTEALQTLRNLSAFSRR